MNPQRQKEPHAHCIVVSPDNKYAFAADLGTETEAYAPPPPVVVYDSYPYHHRHYRYYGPYYGY